MNKIGNNVKKTFHLVFGRFVWTPHKYKATKQKKSIYKVLILTINFMT